MATGNFPPQASTIGEKARDRATTLKERADEAIANVGQGITSLADKLHEKAPQEGMLGSAACTVEENLRTSGQYLKEHHLEEMGRDLTDLVRYYPIQALLISFGIGALVGMTFSRR